MKLRHTSIFQATEVASYSNLLLVEAGSTRPPYLGHEMLSARTVTVTRLSNFPARGRIGCPRQTNARQGQGVGEQHSWQLRFSNSPSFLPIPSIIRAEKFNSAFFLFVFSSSL
jgi:hypothetical protein